MEPSKNKIIHYKLNCIYCNNYAGSRIDVGPFVFTVNTFPIICANCADTVLAAYQKYLPNLEVVKKELPNKLSNSF